MMKDEEIAMSNTNDTHRDDESTAAGSDLFDNTVPQKPKAAARNKSNCRFPTRILILLLVVAVLVGVAVKFAIKMDTDDPVVEPRSSSQFSNSTTAADDSNGDGIPDSFPQVVGMSVTEATAYLELEYPTLTVVVVRSKRDVSSTYDPNRVILMSCHNVVKQTPVVG